MSVEINADRLFIEHIQSHLSPGQKVICKICGKTATEIILKASLKYKDNKKGNPTAPRSFVDLAPLFQQVKAELYLSEKGNSKKVYDLLISLESENAELKAENARLRGGK